MGKVDAVSALFFRCENYKGHTFDFLQNIRYNRTEKRCVMSLSDVMKKMLSRELYDPADPDLAVYQLGCIQRVNEYNQIPATPDGVKQRAAMLKEMFAQVGENCYIEPPLRANMGGVHLRLGDCVYANFNLTLVDDGVITIGDATLIGPNVTIATACHPYNHELRKRGFQYNLPVTIGKNVWIGSGAMIMPGVTIGDNTIIGAGSVVTRDIPSNVIAVGNPCKVLRPITEEDLVTYDHGKPIPPEWLDKYC